MPSPHGEYTPKYGPLAGEHFASYFQYQQARARELGFANYSEERRVTSNPMFRHLENRMVHVQEISHFEARQQLAQQNFAHQHSHTPGRKHNAIAWAMDEGLYDVGDDAADDIPY